MRLNSWKIYVINILILQQAVQAMIKMKTILEDHTSLENFERRTTSSSESGFKKEQDVPIRLPI